MLLLPKTVTFSLEDLEGFFTHELAHWKRRDHWSALISELAVCLLPWHPLVWMAKRRFEQLSELACDQWVLATGGAAADYAESLVNLTPQPGTTLALPALRYGTGIEKRIESILAENRHSPIPGRRWISVISVFSVFLAVAIAFCQPRATASVSEFLASSRMVLVSEGSFEMGGSFHEGRGDDRPVHSVFVSGFLMDEYEVTKGMWDDVYQWAILNGYGFKKSGSSKAVDHPVHLVTWHDAVKWCNARSEKEGRIPAYYTNEAMTTVYRTGRVDVRNDWVNWKVGYRLPAEAEWEKAARGGLSGKRFPWGDRISHKLANYVGSGFHAYDEYKSVTTRIPFTNGLTELPGYHPDFDGKRPYTSPVGSFEPNGYGLYDMAGNVFEWCWDWHGLFYYGSTTEANPHGPPTGTKRVMRGGSYQHGASSARVAGRGKYHPHHPGNMWGFRCVLPADQP